MIGWPAPTPLFNPLIAPVGQEPTPWELLASPAGLFVFFLLIPLTRLLATYERRFAIISLAVVWVIATAGMMTCVAIFGAAIFGLVCVEAIAAGVRTSRVSTAFAKGLVWIVMTAALSPLWWFAQVEWYGWQGARPAVLHNAGFAYLYLRLIAWGVERAGAASAPAGLVDSLAWLLYVPSQRLGPLVTRHDFLERMNAWNPRGAIEWKAAGRRFALFVLGGAALVICVNQIPKVTLGAPDFFTAPSAYATEALLRVLYGVPTQVYLMLWTYNELAATMGLLVGLRVDDNFDHLLYASSIRDFWRRWHITVGGWLRWQVYVPLGGKYRPTLATFGVFFFCGVWHGASWSFLAWGASQAIALTLQRGWDALWEGREARRPRGPAWTALCWLMTMNYQAATIMMFTDFNYCGWRVFSELARRLVGAGG